MSLKDKEVRVPCSDELLKVIGKRATRAGLSNGEWARRIILGHLRRRFHDASVAMADLAELGELRSGPEESGEDW